MTRVECDGDATVARPEWTAISLGYGRPIDLCDDCRSRMRAALIREFGEKFVAPVRPPDGA